jgi:hypothetical protein
MPSGIPTYIPILLSVDEDADGEEEEDEVCDDCGDGMGCADVVSDLVATEF